MSINILLSVAVGGAFGAVGRYLVMSSIGSLLGTGFPYATLLINIIGSFILGAIIEVMALSWFPSLEIRAFIIVGVLGSFTTFSTFSFDIVALLENGEFLATIIYVSVSVITSVVGLFAGMHLLRQVFV